MTLVAVSRICSAWPFFQEGTLVTGRDAIDRSLLQHDTHRLRWTVLAIVGLGVVRAGLMAGRRLLSGQIALEPP